jgi:hypothetical protein
MVGRAARQPSTTTPPVGLDRGGPFSFKVSRAGRDGRPRRVGGPARTASETTATAKKLPVVVRIWAVTGSRRSMRLPSASTPLNRSIDVCRRGCFRLRVTQRGARRRTFAQAPVPAKDFASPARVGIVGPHAMARRGARGRRLPVCRERVAAYAEHAGRWGGEDPRAAPPPRPSGSAGMSEAMGRARRDASGGDGRNARPGSRRPRVAILRPGCCDGAPRRRAGARRARAGCRIEAMVSSS